MKKKLLELLEKLWEKYPEQRLGQLLENFIFEPEKMFNRLDRDIIEKLKEELKWKKINHDSFTRNAMNPKPRLDQIK